MTRRTLIRITLGIALLMPQAAFAGGAQPTCFGRTATIVGTSDSDVLRGTPANDVIVARAGADVVTGKGGNDLICAGRAPDTVSGGDGSDRIFGGSGADDIRGGLERDLLYGAAGDDHLRGGLGRDGLSGGPKADTLDGGKGRRDVALYFLSGRAVEADLANGLATGEGADTLRRIEDLTGSAFGDTLVGNRRDNRLDGGSGSGTDSLSGRGGDDRLFGNRGDDELRGGRGDDFVDDSLERAKGVRPDTGTDLLRGGPGSDSLNAVDETNGNDTVVGGGGTDKCAADPEDSLSGCET